MSETRLDVGSAHSAVRLVLRNISPSRGLGVARLMFTFELASKQQGVVGQLLWLGGQVDLPGLPQHSRPYLASFQAQSHPVALPQLGSEQSLQLTLDISDRQLLLIEERRAGRGIRLDIGLSGYAMHDGQHEFVGEGHLTHEISQSDWVSLLHQLGYRKVLLLEMEAPDPHACPDLAQAIGYYTQAQDRYLEGEWRLTIESLRQCLSSLVGKQADEEEQEADVQAAIRGARRESHNGRLGYAPRQELVRQAAKFLCDLGAHPEVAETRRHHAYGSLVMVGGLLHMFAKPE